MSKLAALAAKRRQKEAVNPAPAADITTTVTSPSDYTASLKKLTIGDSAVKEQRRRQGSERQATALQRQQDEAPTTQESTSVDVDVELRENTSDIIVQRLSKPSVFASTFLSSPIPPDKDSKLDPRMFAGKNVDWDFNKPSPDAIVHKAQTGRNL